MSNTASADQLPQHLAHVNEEGGGFICSDQARKKLICTLTGMMCKDQEVFERLKSHVVPPVWTDVWISAEPNGYLQVTGRDAKGRKQYIYHADYVAYRQEMKFGRMAQFAGGLPKLREEVAKQLLRRDWDKERMIALMVHILDQTKLRIGNEKYLAQNETYGLTTLRRKHLKEQPGGLALDFKGKSNKFRHVAIENKKLQKLLKEIADLPGYRLFRYIDASGKVRELDSGDVNEFLQKHLGDTFSAKDFRTWGGTSLAVKFYPEIFAKVEQRGKGKVDKQLVKAVAKILGNTVSVCKEYYIHPKVLTGSQELTLPHKMWSNSGEIAELADYEQYTLQLISENT